MPSGLFRLQPVAVASVLLVRSKTSAGFDGFVVAAERPG